MQRDIMNQGSITKQTDFSSNLIDAAPTVILLQKSIMSEKT